MSAEEQTPAMETVPALTDLVETASRSSSSSLSSLNMRFRESVSTVETQQVLMKMFNNKSFIMQKLGVSYDHERDIILLNGGQHDGDIPDPNPEWYNPYIPKDQEKDMAKLCQKSRARISACNKKVGMAIAESIAAVLYDDDIRIQVKMFPDVENKYEEEKRASNSTSSWVRYSKRKCEGFFCYEHYLDCLRSGERLIAAYPKLFENVGLHEIDRMAIIFYQNIGVVSLATAIEKGKTEEERELEFAAEDAKQKLAKLKRKREDENEKIANKKNSDESSLSEIGEELKLLKDHAKTIESQLEKMTRREGFMANFIQTDGPTKKKFFRKLKESWDEWNIYFPECAELLPP